MADSVLGKFLSFVDNTKRVAGRNIKDLLTNPEDALQVSGRRLAENIKEAAESDDPTKMMEFVGFGGIIGSAEKILGKAAAKQAREMVKSGATAEETFKALKAYEGPLDKKLRAVISDEGARLNTNATMFAGKEPSFYLDEILSHPELYKSYPELGDMTVKYLDLPDDLRGAYNKPTTFSSGFVEINRKLDEREQLSTLLHELQHAIQNKEGFTPGGNATIARTAPEFADAVTAFTKNPKETADILKSTSIGGRKATILDLATDYVYRNFGGEAEARAVQKALEERNWSKLPLDQYDVNVHNLIAPGVPGKR